MNIFWECLEEMLGGNILIESLQNLKVFQLTERFTFPYNSFTNKRFTVGWRLKVGV